MINGKANNGLIKNYCINILIASISLSWSERINFFKKCSHYLKLKKIKASVQSRRKKCH